MKKEFEEYKKDPKTPRSRAYLRWVLLNYWLNPFKNILEAHKAIEKAASHEEVIGEKLPFVPVQLGLF